MANTEDGQKSIGKDSTFEAPAEFALDVGRLTPKRKAAGLALIPLA